MKVADKANSAVPESRISFKNVLFVTDFSSSSEMALPYAIALAAGYGGKVYIAHVIAPQMWEFVPPDFVPEVLERITAYAQRRMDTLVASSSFEGVAHQALLQQGEIWDTLRQMAHQHGIDVIALGTRGRRGLQKVLMGSVAEEIIRLAHRPVLTVGPQSREISPERKLERILSATDFSINSTRAVRCAVSLADKFAAHLISVYVVPNVVEDPQTMTRFEQFFAERLQEVLLPPAGFQGDLDFRVEFNSAADGILKTAAERDVDLIVMGARGAGSMDRATGHFGTTAYKVVSEARCPVLTVQG